MQFQLWDLGLLAAKMAFLPSFYKLHKFGVLCRSSQAALSVPMPWLPPADGRSAQWMQGLGGSETGAARRGAACLVLVRAGQFILSYFQGTWEENHASS